MKKIIRIFSILLVFTFGCDTTEQTQSISNLDSTSSETDSTVKIKKDIIEQTPVTENPPIMNLQLALYDFCSSKFDSIKSANGLNNLKTNRSHTYCQVDCCTSIDEQIQSEWRVVESSTDCGDNGYYINRWIFHSDSIYFHQDLSSFNYLEIDSVMFINDKLYFWDSTLLELEREITVGEFNSGQKEKQYIKGLATFSKLDSSAKSVVEEFFNAEDIDEDDL